ncbi:MULTISPECIES: Rv3235 family protein [unclassified Rothia (in: high G+C Gram-positive bacteria)]|uniref:Rv3235 family protein n=1 Tax=unclassified Rothia (in: high G+C Gram-positive bacteria) TaxID=2689056 RepID=UPI00195EF3FF|nr:MULTISPECIES: Rv3235 family protein [unclassified Rothia (in: high G+C Gram-positive bacteria)]MBM7050844.1 hypothetical protein [Rothia sp. ZJ1223]QRZ61018.1 hypothetical protein JR346_07060 [Rothia sp. ZJ932]
MNQQSARKETFAVSEAEYKAMLEIIKETERPIVARKQGIPLKTSSELCQSVETMCSGLSIAVLEIFAGRRACSQVAKWFTAECLTKIKRRADLTRRILASKQGEDHLRSPFALSAPLPTVRRAHAQQINETTVEACVIVEDSQRVRALAFKVQRIHRVWKVVEIEIA